MAHFTPANSEELKDAILEMDEETGIHTTHGHINDWDVSRVTDVSEMFYECYAFNHPNMMRFDDDHMSPIEAERTDYTRRLMANVRKKSPELLVGKRKTQKELRVKRKRSRSRSESKKQSHRK